MDDFNTTEFFLCSAFIITTFILFSIFLLIYFTKNINIETIYRTELKKTKQEIDTLYKKFTDHNNLDGIIKKLDICRCIEHEQMNYSDLINISAYEHTLMYFMHIFSLKIPAELLDDEINFRIFMMDFSNGIKYKYSYDKLALSLLLATTFLMKIVSRMDKLGYKMDGEWYELTFEELKKNIKFDEGDFGSINYKQVKMFEGNIRRICIDIING